MRILHISDFHYKGKIVLEQDQIIKALKTSLQEKLPIDLIFFSGDLVNTGTVKRYFEEAHKILILPIQEICNVQRDNIFICQGNHDVNRDRIINSIINHFSNKNTLDSEEFNKWFEANTADVLASYGPSENYFEYAKNYYSFDSKDVIHQLYSTHIRKLNKKSIGIVTLNSSWFCAANRPDRGQLIYHLQYLKDAISYVRNCDLKILVQHHPLSYFNEPLSFELQDLIFSHFNILLNGHVHKESLGMHYKSNNGIYINTTKAALCYDGGEIGYNIIEFDINDLSELVIERSHYIKSENAFVKLDKVVVPIPASEERAKQNKLRKRMFEKYNSEAEEANKLLLDYNESKKRGFLEKFTDPVLSKDSDEQTSASENVRKIPWDEIRALKCNYLIFGKDKCGKTSLLKKLLLEFLHDYPTRQIIPFYIDYKQIESQENNFNLLQKICYYFAIGHKDAETIITDGRLLLLIDNIDTTSSLHKTIVDILSAKPSIRFIICSEYLTSRIFAEELDDLSYDKIFFKSLSRNEIRQYANKNPEIKDDDKDLVIERVTKFCSQLQLPMNYWTVSLIILIFRKSKDDYSKNLFSVLDACVDEMLQKKKYVLEKNELKFEQYKTLCSQIAYALYKDHSAFDYSAQSFAILKIIQDYIHKNPRVVIGAKEIFDYLIDCSILKERVNNLFTFRLNGIFEYFLAYYMKENDSFRNEVLNGEINFLNFKNELEIYSGFNRSDETLLRKVFEKTKFALLPIQQSYNDPLDNLLLEKIDSAFQFSDNIKKILVENPLTDSQRDEAYGKMDEFDIHSDVHAKPELLSADLNVENVEKYLSILSRVFKNLDAVTNSTLIYEIFEYLLESYCRFGFFLIDQFKVSFEEENIKLRSEDNPVQDQIVGEEILKLLSKIVPVLIQAMMYDGIGHMNFKIIIEKKIAEYRVKANENQYKLFILYFLFMDLDVKAHRHLVEDVFEDIRLAPLKISTMFKLNFYLAFKAFNNSSLEQFFRTKIQEIQLKIDGKTDPSDIQKALSKKSKGNIVRKQKDR